MESQELPPQPGDVGLPDDWLVVVPAAGQTVFRMVKHDSPTEDDFLSDRLLGRPRGEHVLEADHLGLSVFAERVQAEAMMRRYPKRIAEVRLEPEHGLSLARTFPLVGGHHTIWGEPDVLARLVESVFVDPGP